MDRCADCCNYSCER